MHLNRLSVVITPAVILVLLASTLVGAERLAFRDVGHFYTPLYEYVAARTQGEWIPLWNPRDQTGIPLVGETTTAVLYPVRYVLFGVLFSANVAMAWYVALHLMLASFSAYFAARWAGASRRAANFAGALYPLSGSVLFLHTNPPFLVGAAWLPLVLGALLSRHPLKSSSRCLIAGIAMAMMVLGGDPQTALHAMMVASVVWAWRFLRSKKGRLQNNETDLRRLGLVLIAAPLLAAALSAPQIAASVSWSRHSDRLRDVDSQGWLQKPKPGTHRSDAFQFSVPPWHFVELLTPNAYGSHLPINRRLSVLIPHDGRMWTPTLYMGMLAAIALLCRLARWRRDGVDVWSATAVVSLLFCLGSFGVVWFIQVCTGTLSGYDGAAGGPYWWLHHLVPGYGSFRYPAKWLPMFAIAASIVTALWLDRGDWRQGMSATHLIRILLGTLLLACLGVSILRLNPAWLTDTFTTWPTDRYFGPLDVAGGLYQIQWSLLHSIIVLAVVMLIMQWQRGERCTAQVAARMLFAVALIDVVISSSALVSRVSVADEQEMFGQVDDVAKPRASLKPSQWRSSMRRMRTQSGGGWPASWRRTRDPNRLTDVAASERLAEFGRWHLPFDRGVLNNVVSIQSNDMAMFWKAATQLTSSMAPREQGDFWHSVRRWLSIHRLIHSSDQENRIEMPSRVAILADVKRIDEDGERDIVQFHSRWTTTDRESATLAKFVALLDEVRVRAASATPLIITDKEIPDARVEPPQVEPQIKTVRLLPSFTEIEIQNGSRGLLTCPTYQDGHWIAEYRTAGFEDWSPLEVHQVNFLSQGVLLPPRCEAVRFMYRPFWLRASIFVSAVAWIILSITLTLKLRRP